MHEAHAHPIVTRMAESRPEEAVIASRYCWLPIFVLGDWDWDWD